MNFVAFGRLLACAFSSSEKAGISRLGIFPGFFKALVFGRNPLNTKAKTNSVESLIIENRSEGNAELSVFMPNGLSKPFVLEPSAVFDSAAEDIKLKDLTGLKVLCNKHETTIEFKPTGIEKRKYYVNKTGNIEESE